jgi:glycosyltransferase involved in cell wall biosynthesis
MFLKLINPLTYHKILSVINNENPDVVHLTLDDLISGIIFVMLKLKGKCLVFTEHDPILHSGESFISKCHLIVTKFLLRSVSNKIIVHGQRLKDILVQKGVSEKKICVIPHGEFSYYAKWSQNVSEIKNSILFFGRIEDYKGLDCLIRAVPIIATSVPDLKVIIAGAGNLSKYLGMIKDKKYFEICNRYILDEEIADFFQRASVVVLPYKDGTQSGIVPIAYAFKKPVVVTNVGSIQEVVDDNITGFVVPPNNPHSLSKAIVKILSNDAMRNRMGGNGYKEINSFLSWEVIAKKTIEVYVDL